MGHSHAWKPWQEQMPNDLFVAHSSASTKDGNGLYQVEASIFIMGDCKVRKQAEPNRAAHDRQAGEARPAAGPAGRRSPSLAELSRRTGRFGSAKSGNIWIQGVLEEVSRTSNFSISLGVFPPAMMWTTKWNPWPAAYNGPTQPLYLIFLIPGILSFGLHDLCLVQVEGLQPGFSQNRPLHLPHGSLQGEFTVIGPVGIFQAKKGEDVLLPCHLSPKMDARNMTVKWFRNQTLVHSYPNEDKVEETQDPEFQGRTELLKDDLAEGKVILRIHQVQLSDAGHYICQFQSPGYSNDASFELQVTDNFPTYKKTLIVIVAVCLLFTVSSLVIYFFWKRNLLGTREIISSCKV
ncbi:uncharacterized protein LOC122747913 [Dromiciops gliroides]|uniref:uncharacterized protein LOC122747913 n=1 Tax=Dromiciops gliroides TaxID=33562 RepID=UPI001CC68F44|nr:uncharacterized protein LOC122747913 [Dromiciops gliroides]